LLPRFTRGVKPRCINYAPSKEEFEDRFPGYLFCSSCDAVVRDYCCDASPSKRNKKISSRQYACSANHEGYVAPSTKVKSPWYRSNILWGSYNNESTTTDDESTMQAGTTGTANITKKPRNESTTTDDDESMHAGTTTYSAKKPRIILPPPPPLPPPAAAAVAAAEATARSNFGPAPVPIISARNYELIGRMMLEYPPMIKKLKEENSNLKERCSHLQSKCEHLSRNKTTTPTETTNTVTGNDPVELTRRAVNIFAANPSHFDSETSGVRRDSTNKQQIRMQKFLSEVMLTKEDGLFGNQLRYSTISAVTKIMRDDIFTPFKFIKQMDMHGHVLSLKGIDCIRQMQGLDNYSRNGIFASMSSITRAAAVVEQYGKHLVPYILRNVSYDLGGGECLEFDEKKALKVILPACGLHTASKSSRVTLSPGFDGVHIWKGYHILILAIKNNSGLGHTPFSKQPNLLIDGDKVQSNIQSPDNCFPLKIVVGSETKAMIQTEFKDLILKFKNETELDDDDVSSLLETGHRPLFCPFTADMAGECCCIGCFEFLL